MLRRYRLPAAGGVLIAAIAFVLVPEGQAYFESPKTGVAIFLLGGLAFMQVERYLSNSIKSVNSVASDITWLALEGKRLECATGRPLLATEFKQLDPK